MRKNSHLFIKIISLIIIILFPVISLADADRIFKENNEAVIVVLTYDRKGKLIGQGSGFVVRQDGAIVTNYHVISNAANIKVRVGEKILEVEGLLHIDKENDIVILKAKGKNLKTVKTGDIEKLAVGEKVYVISSPQGLENTISDGILSGIREIEPERKILQITAPISKGSSGGAVFNKNGEVVGIATFLIEEAQNINFAMPVNLIKDKISVRKVIALKDAEIKDYKETAESWFILGIAYYDSGMYQQEIDSYKQAIRIKPNYAEAHNNLGVAYGKLGMHRQAIDSFKQAIRIKPDFAMAHYGLGLTYLIIGNRTFALEQYKILKSLDPKLAEDLFSLIYR
jgi:tetratricopeptide (TPR) repeat protein